MNALPVAQSPAIRTQGKILALCYVLPPALFPQAIQIGRLLAHSGHAIARVSGPLGQPRQHATVAAAPPPPHLIVPDVTVQWPRLHRLALKLLPRYGSAPDAQRAWVAATEIAVMQSEAIAVFAPEVIASFGEPMSGHLLGQSLQRRLELPWIAHFSDPWADNPYRPRHKLSHRINKSLEAGVIENADQLIFTSEETRQLLARTYGATLLGKSHVLPHSFEPALYPPMPPPSGDQITLRYLGNFYGIRRPYPLLEAIEILRQRQPDLARRLRFELIGGLPGWMKLHPLVRRADPDCVRFLPTVSYQSSLDYMVSADMLLVIDAPAKTSVFLPSKLIDYIGARRPIFGIVPPGTSARVIAAQGGLTADPSDPPAIAAALAKIAADPLAMRAAATTTGTALGATYEAATVAAHFDALVAQVLRGTRIGTQP